MKTSKQYQITLENGDKCIITDADLKHRSRLLLHRCGTGIWNGGSRGNHAATK